MLWVDFKILLGASCSLVVVNPVTLKGSSELKLGKGVGEVTHLETQRVVNEVCGIVNAAMAEVAIGPKGAMLNDLIRYRY